MGEQKERMLRGELYRYDDPDLIEDHLHGRALVERFNATRAADAEERRAILEELLDGATILDCAPVRIGNEVQIATCVQLLTATHPLDAKPRRASWESAAPVIIEDGVWLGGGAIVCPGVTVGENTVVGAGAVVVRDLPPGVLAVGNPARPVREL